MYFKFGNLTVRQFLERIEGEATEEEIATLEAYRTDAAEFTDPARFHIFCDPAISIHIGPAALRDVGPIFMALDARKPFNRPVAFFGVGSEAEVAEAAANATQARGTQ